MEMAKLSILICTIYGREASFDKLIKELDRQYTKDIEVMSIKDDKQVSVGVKRQRLLEAATGDYVCFIDDDDMIAPTYVKDILKAIESEPDCVGFEIDCDIDGVKTRAISSLKYRSWTEKKDGYRYNRSIYHKTPVKRAIALKVGFQDKRYAEDYEYSMALQPYLNTEEFIKKPLYFYTRIDNEPHNKRYGIGR
jgi:glycosyltransferase involved in cell wall biosynthesis